MRRILLYIVALIMLLGVITPTHAHAQENAEGEVWFWATTPDGLVSYTLDGQINVLVDDPALSETFFQGTRLSNDTAVLYNQDAGLIYVVSPETATAIPLDEKFDGFWPRAYQYPYVIFTGMRVFPAAGVLNIETMSLSSLSGFVDPARPNIVFVDDTTLRYHSFAEVAPDRETVNTLWERDLVTGEETALMEIEGYGTGVFNSLDGQQWWIKGQIDPDTRALTEVTTFGEVNPDVTAQMNNFGAAVWFDRLVTMDVECKADCLVTVTPLTDGESLTFTVPTHDFFIPRIIAVAPDGSLLIAHRVEEETLYRLDPAGNLTELGISDFQKMSTLALNSADGRWAVVLKYGDEADAYTYRIWDMTTGQLVHEAPLDIFLAAGFADESVFILNGSTYNLYHAGTMYDLSKVEGRFSQALPNAQMLFEPSADSEMANGIYLLDVPTDTLTLLVPEGQGIGLVILASQN